mmetsp:Transcript_45359/g.98416  ORF Transcript_45359/g.98416 Transcript_45359/m.98416 type:complete len:250 (-) Transcript_45359:1488-2237(-)
MAPAHRVGPALQFLLFRWQRPRNACQSSSNLLLGEIAENDIRHSCLAHCPRLEKPDRDSGFQLHTCSPSILIRLQQLLGLVDGLADRDFSMGTGPNRVCLQHSQLQQEMSKEELLPIQLQKAGQSLELHVRRPLHRQKLRPHNLEQRDLQIRNQRGIVFQIPPVRGSNGFNVFYLRSGHQAGESHGDHQVILQCVHSCDTVEEPHSQEQSLTRHFQLPRVSHDLLHHSTAHQGGGGAGGSLEQRLTRRH